MLCCFLTLASSDFFITVMKKSQRQQQQKDDDVIFVYESRILTPARPEVSNNVVVEDESSNSSFVFNLQQNKSANSTQIVDEQSSIVFVPNNVDVIDVASNTVTESVQMVGVASTSRGSESTNKMSHVSIVDSDDDDDEPVRPERKKKPPLKPVVVLKKLPQQLFHTEQSINLATNRPLNEFLHHEEELLSNDVTVNVENLALHGETSTSKRVQRLSLKKTAARLRRQRHLRSDDRNGDITVTRSTDRNRRTYCAFCEQWVTDIKLHRKQHVIQKFRCEVCGKEYALNTHLTQHFRKMHNDVLQL